MRKKTTKTAEVVETQTPIEFLPELLEVLRKIPAKKRARMIEAANILLDAEEDNGIQIPIRPRPPGGIRYGIPC